MGLVEGGEGVDAASDATESETSGGKRGLTNAKQKKTKKNKEKEKGNRNKKEKRRKKTRKYLVGLVEGGEVEDAASDARPAVACPSAASVPPFRYLSTAFPLP
eukprot:2727825-Rhodomonas_salina.1